MSAALASMDVERLRSAVARHLGLSFDDGKLGFLGEVLARRLESGHHRAESYLESLEGALAESEEVQALARELTVGETYFFRHMDQFRAFAEVALPDRMRDRQAAPRLRLLSAGCATGEEAYSLSILARETVADPSWEIAVLGVDVNRAALANAARGRYPAWSLRETPPTERRRWFRPEGREFVLDEEVRASVAFQERNLVRDDADLWLPGAYDVVFCRNVLMYMTLQNAQALVGRIARSLAPGGYLFLGHAETLRGLSNDFQLCHTHDTFYYRRRVSPDAAGAPGDPGEYGAPVTGSPQPDAALAAPSSAPLLAPPSESWMETIDRAAQRIQTLSSRVLGDERPAPAWNRGPALDLLRQERFAEALALVQSRPEEQERDADLLLLQAVLLTHGGELAAAEAVCRELLDKDDLNAGAHYVLALCREGAADSRGAMEHDQVAVYLDPAFAMPRLHLGLLARRTGDRDTARRELTQALTLLQREDAARLLLFGGGFGREALVALCRGELVACGGGRS